MEQNIGSRLRDLRQRRGLSQRGLARATGVANATISQIEAGRLNPTVSLLKKVLDGFPVSLGEFFSADEAPQERFFFRSDEFVEIAEGGVSYRQVGPNAAGRSLQMMQERYAPGATTGRHELTHDGEECGIVLSGRLEVTVGDRRAVLRAGDAYYFQSSLPHGFRNVGSKPCELVSVCSPPSF